MNPFPQHLLSLQNLSQDIILAILKRAQKFLDLLESKGELVDRSLADKVITHLFFEPSTRTHYSFVLAAHHLKTIVLNPVLNSSSINKGESFLDTVRTFEALGTDVLVIRHPQNGILEWLSTQLITSKTHLLNAGEGTSEHPTQGLIDLLTIWQHKKSWKQLSVAIVGDILHSRVANSLITGLLTMGVSDIRLVAPAEFLPTRLPPGVNAFHVVEHGVKQVDVIVSLRLQKERFKSEKVAPALLEYPNYCLTTTHLKFAKPDAIVMHPGPVNRGVEMTNELVDSKQSVILQQVKNGVAVRMAVLEFLLMPRIS